MRNYRQPSFARGKVAKFEDGKDSFVSPIYNTQDVANLQNDYGRFGYQLVNPIDQAAAEETDYIANRYGSSTIRPGDATYRWAHTPAMSTDKIPLSVAATYGSLGGQYGSLIGKIKVRPEYVNDYGVMGHEYGHAYDSPEGLDTIDAREAGLLNSAYGFTKQTTLDDMVNHYNGLTGDEFNREAKAINRGARAYIQSQNNWATGADLEKIIMNMSDRNLMNAVYMGGRSYVTDQNKQRGIFQQFANPEYKKNLQRALLQVAYKQPRTSKVFV